MRSFLDWNSSESMHKWRIGILILAALFACAAVGFPPLGIVAAILGVLGEVVFGRRERTLESSEKRALRQEIIQMGLEQERLSRDQADEARRIGKGMVIEGRNPLSAKKRGQTAEINVAAFAARFEDKSNPVSYNSGSITSLHAGETYYIFAMDACRTGGSVAYQAAVTPNTALAGRDKIYIGSIRTPD